MSIFKHERLGYEKNLLISGLKLFKSQQFASPSVAIILYFVLQFYG